MRWWAEQLAVAKTCSAKPSLLASLASSPSVWCGSAQVGPSVWLGRVWLADLVKSWNPSNPTPMQAWFQNYFEPLQNMTVNLAAVALGLQGPASTPSTAGNHYEPASPSLKRGQTVRLPRKRPNASICHASHPIVASRCKSIWAGVWVSAALSGEAYSLLNNNLEMLQNNP